MYVGEFSNPVIDSILFSLLNVVDCVHYVFHCHSNIESARYIAIGEDISIVYEILGGKI